jgi:uncharacterized protein
MPEHTLTLQRAMADLALCPGKGSFTSDPQGFAARFDLPLGDQLAFKRFQDRLMAYRELVRLSIEEPVAEMFPITRILMARVNAWESCLDAFMDARCISSPHYRDIAPAFLGWLAETHWGQERWPYLLELAHFEILPVLVTSHPDAPVPTGLHDEPTRLDLLVLDPATQVTSYSYAVHRTTEQVPVPEARPAHLLAFRDEKEDFQLMELSATTAALLVATSRTPLEESAQELHITDLQAALDLLRDLRERGAIAGFRPVL